MKLTGYTEIDDETYKSDLILAFSDFITDNSVEQNKSHLIECIKDRLGDDCPDFYLNEDTIAQTIEDTKRFIRETLKTI